MSQMSQERHGQRRSESIPREPLRYCLSLWPRNFTSYSHSFGAVSSPHFTSNARTFQPKSPKMHPSFFGEKRDKKSGQIIRNALLVDSELGFCLCVPLPGEGRRR
jgi:hypothetical protein